MSIIVKVKEMIWAWICLRSCNVVGALPRLQGRVFVNNGGRIEIGERVRLRGSHVPIELGALPGGVLRIGKNCCINSGVSIAAATRVTIGDNCLIGNYSLIMDTDFHHASGPGVPCANEPVEICDDVWVASGVTILKGVTIGKGAVVAAGAVVARSVPEYTLVGGVPARPIKTLPRPESQRPAPDSGAPKV